MRIAGIDHEVSNLEVLWTTAEKEERLRLAVALFGDVAGEVGGFEIKAELGSGETITISVDIEEN